MTAWIAENIFNSLVGWLGAAGIVVVICGVVAWFIPGFRRIAIEVGALAIAAATIYARGNRDEARKWNKAIEHDVQKGQQARADAVRDVAAGSVRGSEWDRDGRSM